jgi:hypothetical protein
VRKKWHGWCGQRLMIRTGRKNDASAGNNTKRKATQSHRSE